MDSRPEGLKSSSWDTAVQDTRYMLTPIIIMVIDYSLVYVHKYITILARKKWFIIL